MALTKISRGLLNTGVSDSSDANAITISSAEKVTVTNTLNAPTSIQTPLIEFTDGDDAIAIADGGAVTMAKLGAIGATTAGTGAFTTLTTSSNLTVGGNLTVTGTSTVVDTVTMNAQNAVIFEGATADNYETTLSIVDPTADHTQYLINQDGYIPVLAAATTTAISSTPAELNLLDGSVANSVVNSKAVIYGGSGQLAGTLSTAAQTNITSLGTLSSLAVSGNQTVGGTLGVTGVVTANAGIQVDALNLDGRTIASTDTNGNINISPHGTGNVVLNTDSLSVISTGEGATVHILAGEAENATIILSADESDDAGDDWNIVNAASNNALTFRNDISGSAVSQITLTPHATVASSTTAIAGNTTVGGTLGVTGATTLSSTLGVTGALTGTSATFTPSSGENFVIARDSGGPYIGASSNHSLRIITNNAERMRFDTSGNVGIGVAPSTGWPNSTDFRVLQIGTGLVLFGRGSGDHERIGLAANLYHDGSAWKHLVTGRVTSYEQNDGKHIFKYHASQSAGTSVTPTTAMTIDTAGKVGIGVTPAEHFHVFSAGHFKVDVGASPIVEIANNSASGSTSGTATLKFTQANTTAGGSIISGRDSNYTGGDNRDSYMAFQTALNAADTEKMRISSTGNVGIGGPIDSYYSGPEGKLDVQGTGYFGYQDYTTQGTQKAMVLRGDPVSGSYSQSRFNFYTEPGTTSNGIAKIHIKSQYGTASESSELFTFGSSGKFGIGNTAPGTLLHVGKSTTAASVVTITHENADGYGSLDIDSYGSATFRMLSNFSGSTVNGMANDTFSLMTPHSFPILFGTAGVERMRIDSAGRLSLGPDASDILIDPASTNSANNLIYMRGNASGDKSSIQMNHYGNADYHIGVGHVASGKFNIANDLTGADFVIDTAGKVGIGTASPSAILEVVDAASGAPGTTLKVYSAQNSAATDGLVFIHSDQSLAPFTALNVRQDGTGDILNLLDGTTEVFTVVNGGSVGIGLTDPRGDMWMTSATSNTTDRWGFGGGKSGTNKVWYTINQNNAGVYVGFGNTSWTAHSDERIKDNIVSLGTVLPDLMNMRCVKYNRFGDDGVNKTKIGFIAQDWETKFPEIIDEMGGLVIEDDGTLSMEDDSDSTIIAKGLSYTETIPVLLKAIQELEEKLNIREGELEQRIHELEQRLV